ncbi:nitrite/Sulfite reductase ferredoxin-like half domain protein, partial [Vibrio parahaemolyticus V-223/04]
MPSGTN